MELIELLQCKWYKSNPATLVNSVFNAPNKGKDPKTKVR